MYYNMKIIPKFYNIICLINDNDSKESFYKAELPLLVTDLKRDL